MRTRLTHLLSGVLVILSLTACAPPDDQRTDTLDPTTAGQGLSAEARVQLDSGNTAFRAGDMNAALVHFTRVTELMPDDPTGWFGVYMVHDARGDQTAAESAMEMARSRAPGASLIRDTLGSNP